MIAALATCTFLIAGWAALFSMVVGADDSGSKVIAAFKGQSLASREQPPLRPVTVRFSSRGAPRSKPMRAKAEWRAAA